MHKLKHMNYSYYFSILTLVISFGVLLNLFSVSIINAQQPREKEQATSENIPENTSQTQPRPRLRPSFFEEQRKLPRFGFGDFLRSALDNEQNTFADPAKVSEFGSKAFPFFASPGQTQGTLTVGNRDTNSGDFLNGTSFTGAAGNLNFSSFSRGSDPRQGTVTLNGSLNINGRTVNFNNTRVNYNVGFSSKGDNASGVAVFTDPNNRQQSILLQVPTTNIGRRDDSVPFSAPAGLTVGFPSDR